MGILERFFDYARDFELTLRDDDWSRLRDYFAPNAQYQVKNSPFACVLDGRDAIFRGIKKSLDGFDRKFPGRKLEVTQAPEVAGDTLALSWAVTYERPGSPPLTLRGRSEARFAGDVITHLSDTYTEANNQEAASWLRAHGKDIDGSYV